MKNILTLLTASVLMTTSSLSTSIILETSFDNLSLNQNNKINFFNKNLKNWNMSSFIDHILTVYNGNQLYWMMNQKINNKVNEILSNNKISQKKLNETLDSTETSLLKNEQDQEQQISTQEYDKQVNTTYSVTNKIDVGITDTIKIPFDEIKLNFNFSNSTTQTTSTTETVKAPSQKINVSPHKETSVDYDLYSVNYENNYVLKVKLDINSNFSGELHFGSGGGINMGWKEYNFYDVLRKIGLDKPDENNLMYAADDGLYCIIPLTLDSKGYDLNVDIKPEQPIEN